MTVEDISLANKKQLQKSLKIKELLRNIPNDKEIWECKNGELFYLATSNLTTQMKAPLGEKFLCHMLNLKAVSSKENRGDAVDNNNVYYEIKCSFTNKEENLNIRQIRLWQDIDYYYCFYINEEELEKSLFFILSKKQMEEEVRLCGSCSHGTIEVNKNNFNKEYSITIPAYKNTEKAKRWKEKYLSIDLKKKILGGE